MAEYEAQWSAWRAHLLAQREELKKQRIESATQVPPASQGAVTAPTGKPPIGPQLPTIGHTNPMPDTAPATGYTPSAYQAASVAQPPITYEKYSHNARSVPPGRPGYQQQQGGYHHHHPYFEDSHSAANSYPPNHSYEDFPNYDDYAQPGSYRAKQFNQTRYGGPRDHRDHPFQHDMAGPPMEPRLGMISGIRPLPDVYPDALYRGEHIELARGPEPLEPEPLTPIPPGETAASMFRKRALRGKGADPTNTFHEDAPPVADGAPVRPRIEERLAVVAEIKLSLAGTAAAAAPELESKPNHEVGAAVAKDLVPIVKDYSKLGPSKPAISSASYATMEPAVFEYFHRPPSQNKGRFSIERPICVDYSHGKRPRRDSEAPTKPPLPVNEPLVKREGLPTPAVKAEKLETTTASNNNSNSIKSTPPPPAQLFPSAAAIQETGAQQCNLPQSLPNPADEGNANNGETNTLTKE